MFDLFEHEPRVMHEASPAGVSVTPSLVRYSRRNQLFLEILDTVARGRRRQMPTACGARQILRVGNSAVIRLKSTKSKCMERGD